MVNLQCFSVTTAEQTSRSPQNKSPSKQMYSFSKANRFVPIKSYCQQPFYNQNSKKSRGAGIGYGTKVNWTQIQIHSPQFTKYTPYKSPFERSKSQQRGKTFGTGRENMQEGSHILPGPLKNPGPGQYQNEKSKINVKYTLRKRTPAPNIPVFLQDSVKPSWFTGPGPSKYIDNSSINEKGEFPVSKYPNTQTVPFSPLSSFRFPQMKITPGPGDYMGNLSQTQKSFRPDLSKVISNLDTKQSPEYYKLSQYRTQGKRIISKEQRKTYVQTEIDRLRNVPGPGSYQQMSEFGQYDKNILLDRSLMEHSARSRSNQNLNKTTFIDQ